MGVSEKLLKNTIKSINKLSENKSVADVGSAIDDVSEFISTSNELLDIVISNKIGGGIPVGRLVELSGLESAGKSLLAVSLIRDVQKKGGMAVYVDVERSFNKDFYTMLGADLNKVLVIEEDIIEKIYEYIEAIIYELQSDEEYDAPTLIIVDSLTAAAAEADLDNKYGLDGYATHKARINSKSLKRIASLCSRYRTTVIFTSQLRHKMNAMPFADPYAESSGGKALQFYASLRLRLTSSKKITKTVDKVKNVIGKNIKLMVKKSRLGTEYNVMTFNILYNSGIENYNSWLDLMKKYKIVTGGAGGNYKLHKLDFDSGEIEEIKFKSKDFIELLENNKELKENVLLQLYDKIAIKYENKVEQIDEDLTIEEEYSEENN